ncbi:MAG: hypothetical protein V4662_08070 [Verrucomicrobiota bacterium]
MMSILHTDGSGESDVPTEQLLALYDELQHADREHGEVSVTNDDNGWAISAHRDGRVVLVHLVTFEAFHMIPVTRGEVLNLWQSLIGGDIAGLQRLPWRAGYT